jgi:hypothetical protein
MRKSALPATRRTELHQHDFSTFIDDPPTFAQGGKDVVVTGCPKCKKQFGTLPQFLDHLPTMLYRNSEILSRDFGRDCRMGIPKSTNHPATRGAYETELP